MKYYNAVQAAKRIGVSDKTVRNWIAEGKLHATRTPSNRLGIPENEVEALRKEYAQFSQQEEKASAPSSDILALSTKIQVLEQRCQSLEQRVTELEQRRLTEKALQSPVSTFTPYDTSPISRAQKRTTMPTVSTPTELPPGSLLFADFAEKYGVPRATFAHHVKDGIAGDAPVETTNRPKPGRPDHTERWLTPEQQEKALAFWDKHGVRYTRPTEGEAATASEPAWYTPGDEGKDD